MEDMQVFVKLLVRRKPDKVIIHVGTNNLNKDRPKHIKNKAAELVENIRTQEPTVQMAVFSIVRRVDWQRLNESISQVNKALETVCKSNGWDFISHEIFSMDCLNNSGLHFTTGDFLISHEILEIICKLIEILLMRIARPSRQS